MDGNGDSHQTPKTQETPDPETPGQTLAPKARAGLSRRRALTVIGIGTGALIAEQALVSDGIPPAAGPPAGSGFPAAQARSASPEPGGDAPLLPVS